MKFRKQRWRWKFLPIRDRLAYLVSCVFAAALMSSPAWSQSELGQADVTLQGYAFGQSSRVSSIGGISTQFSEFLPGVGLLNGRFEGYDRDRNVETGDNYLELRGLPVRGFRWSLIGGDFRTPSSLVEFPFQNIFYPEISARGTKIEAIRGEERFTFFWGGETLLDGPRVTFRLRVPQSVLGASYQRRFRERWQVGVRYLHLASDTADVLSTPFYFPANRNFTTSTSLTAQSLYSPIKGLKLYAEGTISASAAASPQSNAVPAPRSGLAGLAWDSPKLSLRANYAQQSASYLPLLGYFAGDRRGPFGEVTYRPIRQLTTFASGGIATNNLERNPLVPTFRSQTTSGGATLQLPARFSVNGQISEIHFRSSQPGDDMARLSNNRQIVLGIARPIGRHNLRLSLRDLTLRADGLPNRQRSTEIEDSVQIKHAMVGGAARLQQSANLQSTNTIFVRAFGQASFRRFTVYAHLEKGDDLLNRSVFATSNYKTAIVGVTARLTHGWDLQAEAFSNSLISTLTPENVFLQGTQGVAVTNLTGLNQSSIYFRLTKHLHWGGPMPADGLDKYAEALTRPTGVVEGIVKSVGIGGKLPALGVPVSLGDQRSALTDDEGRFQFLNVPEGAYRVMLAVRELPAEYDPGPSFEAEVHVVPRRAAAVDLEVWRLGSISGEAVSADSTCRSNLLVRLPSGRYTTTDADGSFGFYNLHEGEYEVAVDEDRLPDGCVLMGTRHAPITVQRNAVQPTVRFDLKFVERQKPVRQILIDSESRER